jgi:hypothetical protein
MRPRASFWALLLLPLLLLLAHVAPVHAAARTDDAIVAAALGPAEPGRPEPARPEPGKAEPGKAEPGRADPGGYSDWTSNIRLMMSDEAIEIAKRVLIAILIFIGGWIVAKLLAYGVFSLLGRTQVDNKVAGWLGLDTLISRRTGQAAPEDGTALERFIAKGVYWLVMLLVVVGVLQYAGLSQVASPIERFVDTVMQALPRIIAAAAIIAAAWAVGYGLRFLVTRALDRAGIDHRFAELSETKAADSKPFSQAVGSVVYWLLIVVGLAAAFDQLELGPIAQPLRNAIDAMVGLLPKLGLAVVLLLLGWYGGRIARAVVRNVLAGLGFDKLVAKVQLDKLTGSASPSDVVGMVAQAFIVVQASIAALDELGLETLSVPLTAMMARFWTLLPAIAVSVLIVIVGVIVGQLLRRVVAATLRNVGFERLMQRLGFEKLADRPDRLGEYSELVGYFVQIAVILLAIAQALDNLQLDMWSGYVNAFLEYTVKNVAVALLVVGIGFAIGNYVRDLIVARGGAEEPPRWLGEFARYAVLVFAFTMAVRQLDVAEDFVLITFGLLFGSLCLAAALAFGLGGREVAAEVVKRRYEQARSRLAAPRRPPPPSPPPGAAP